MLEITLRDWDGQRQYCFAEDVVKDNAKGFVQDMLKRMPPDARSFLVAFSKLVGNANSSQTDLT